MPGARAPFRVIGPLGAKTLMSHLEQAYAADIKIRIEDEKLPPEGIAIAVEEFDRDGVVYERRRRQGDRLRGRSWRRDQARLRLPHRVRRPRRGDLGRHALQRERHQVRSRRRPADARGGGAPAGADGARPTSSASSPTTRRRAKPASFSRAQIRSLPPIRTSSCSASDTDSAADRR